MRWLIGCIAVLAVTGAIVLARCGSPHRDPCPLPPRECTAHCDELVWFAPSRGPGYEDVPLDGEDTTPESTTYLRRDLMIAIKYAAAKVRCTAGGHPLVLGDASDRNGETPGMLRLEPRHPRNTHVAGRDIDLGYYQRGTPDNNLRAICPHELEGIEQWHCTSPPTTLDARRTALFLGFLFESPHVRVVGVDGLAAPPIQRALERACTKRTIELVACARIKIAYETEDTGRLWYRGHHGHMHVSWRGE